jgi:uncharacterized RDD family membrane protein YckC
MNEKRWYYFSDNKQVGPVSAETIQDLLSARVLHSNTHVWTSGFEKWQPMKNVDAFHSDYPPTIPPRLTNATTKIEDINFEEPVPQVRPWVRYWARMMDIFLFGLVFGGVAGILYPPILDVHDTLLGMILLFVYLFFEPIMLTAWGTTPGKALLRISISKANGDKPTYREALSRSVSIWAGGLGFGIPLVSLITLVLSFSRLKKDGITSWDKGGNFRVSHWRIGPIRVITIILIFIAFFFLMAWGTANP